MFISGTNGSVMIRTLFLILLTSSSFNSKRVIRQLSMTSSSARKFLEYPSDHSLKKASFVDRYKRFLADVKLEGEAIHHPMDNVKDDGTVVVHCPNTGPMISLLPSSRETPLQCAVSCISDESLKKSKRKYRMTLEIVEIEHKIYVGIHSALANRIVANALAANLVEEFIGCSSIKREIKLGDSTIDFELLFEDERSHMVKKRILIEVKSVTLAVDERDDKQRRAVFPDCVSDRATRHANCLTDHQIKCDSSSSKNSITTETVILFLIQRHDCSSFSASTYDIEYAKALNRARQHGVKILPYHIRLDPFNEKQIEWMGKLPFIDIIEEKEVNEEEFEATSGGGTTKKNNKKKNMVSNTTISNKKAKL